MSGIDYKAAGVDIDAGNETVRRIKSIARSTFTAGVLSEIGSFGGLFTLAGGGWTDPVLVSSADGVGTKLKVAFLAGVHDTIGRDLVNHCVNDIMVQGAEPLFFLDYYATGKLSASVLEQVVEGLSRGCKANGCALIGGETAEMPGFYPDGEYDLAGFITGVVEQGGLITGDRIRAGDVLLGLPSNGLHTNGYSLARKLLFEVAGYKVDSRPEGLAATVSEELLKVHRSYAAPIRALRKAKLLKGAAHITGGGITGNTPRMLPKGLAAEIDTRAWEPPALFQMLRRIGNVPLDDWRQTFNLGIGMVLAVSAKKVDEAERRLRKAGEKPVRLGGVVSRARGARVLYTSAGRS